MRATGFLARSKKGGPDDHPRRVKPLCDSYVDVGCRAGDGTLGLAEIDTYDLTLVTGSDGLALHAFTFVSCLAGEAAAT